MSSQPNPHSNIEIQKEMQKQKKPKKKTQQEQTKNSLLEKNKVEGVASPIMKTLSRQRSKDPWSKHSETLLHISKSLHMNNAKISGERRVFLVNGNLFEGKRGLYFGPYKNFCRNTSHSVSAKKDPVTTRSAILVLRRLR